MGTEELHSASMKSALDSVMRSVTSVTGASEVRANFTRAGCVILACVTFSSCRAKKGSAEADESKPPPPFSETAFSEVIPMLDGSAYARSNDARLWHLRGGKAVRVSVLAGASQNLPDFLEITPVLDGSAYGSSTIEPGLWHLRAEHAERVTEVSSVADAGPPKRIAKNAFYALYLSEQKKRKAAEDRAENPVEAEYYDPPEDPRF